MCGSWLSSCVFTVFQPCKKEWTQGTTSPWKLFFFFPANGSVDCNWKQLIRQGRGKKTRRKGVKKEEEEEEDEEKERERERASTQYKEKPRKTKPVDEHMAMVPGHLLCVGTRKSTKMLKLLPNS